MGPLPLHGHMYKVQSGRQRDRRSSHSILASSTQPLLHLLTLCAEDLGACCLYLWEFWTPDMGGHTTATSSWQMARRSHLGLSRGQVVKHQGKEMTRKRMWGTPALAAGPVNLTLPIPWGECMRCSRLHAQ